jgi:hypothetical protein
LRTVQRPIHREKAKRRGMKKQVDDFVLGEMALPGKAAGVDPE